MNNNRRQKLIAPGAEILVDALLNPAIYSDEADDLIEQLIAMPKESGYYPEDKTARTSANFTLHTAWQMLYCK